MLRNEDESNKYSSYCFHFDKFFYFSLTFSPEWDWQGGILNVKQWIFLTEELSLQYLSDSSGDCGVCLPQTDWISVGNLRGELILVKCWNTGKFYKYLESPGGGGGRDRAGQRSSWFSDISQLGCPPAPLWPGGTFSPPSGGGKAPPQHLGSIGSEE